MIYTLVVKGETDLFDFACHAFTVADITSMYTISEMVDGIIPIPVVGIIAMHSISICG